MSDTDHKGAKKALELRLALVCYGGVSLAVYMHGVTREILNLVRASKQVRDKVPSPPNRDATSQHVYAELIDLLSDTVQLRVVVDVIAGASAGGINGVMLARALAYNLPLDSHRKMWLELADVTELLDPSGRAKLWSKPFMRPMLALINWWQSKNLGQISTDAARSLEVRQKLSLFTRSRWFHPPFCGKRMTRMMVDGLRSLGADDPVNGSLLPTDHPLDLFVTTTDFWGHRQLLTLHDPPVIVEREHRHVLSFRFQKHGAQDDETQLSEEDIPGLAFAARATSCFPGAFPPVQLSEIDGVLSEMDLVWNTRNAFVNRSFKAHLAEGESVEEAAFIDGSVLMNKPLDLAIRAVQDRSANRQVDRRIVYIDPNPDKRSRKGSGPPGFFATLKGSLSDIPRNQPIRDDLEWLNDFNSKSENFHQIVTALTPMVALAVSKIRSKLWAQDLTREKLTHWRVKANVSAAQNAGFAYGGYARLKVLTVLEEVAASLVGASGITQDALVQNELDQWAFRQNILPIKDASHDAQDGGKAPWVKVLKSYDLRYRVRRIRFILRRLNELYRTVRDDRDEDRDWLNRTKEALYDSIRGFERAAKLDGLEGITSTFMPDGALTDTNAVDAILVDVAASYNLEVLDTAFESNLIEIFNDSPNHDMATQLIDCYLGFAFFDVATLPMTQWRDLYELDEVRVDRISANDANSLDRGGAGQLLKGAEMANFGAFFSRAYRENDYLWGRLTGAERLIDLVLSAVPGHGHDAMVLNLKQRAFEMILQEERQYLSHIPDIFEDIEKRVRAMI